MTKIVLYVNILVLFSVSGISMLFSTNRNVYICKGKSSERYHLDKECRGLKNCSTDIYSVSLEEARKLGRTLCGWED